MAGTVASDRSSWNTRTNLADYLVHRHVREGRGDRVALLYEGAQLTYGELSSLVGVGAVFMVERGVEAGDRVVLALPDSPAFVVAFFAALHVGAIVVPLNPSLPSEELIAVAARVDPAMGFVSLGGAEKFAGLADVVPAFVRAGDLVGDGGELEEELSRLGGVAPPEPSSNSDQTAYILHSSGTTGVPKGIPHRHVDILHCIAAYSIDVLGMTPNERVLAVPKLTFGYGLGGNLLSAFYLGATSILLAEPVSARLMAEAARRYAPTLFLSQPRLLLALLQEGEGVAFAGLRLAVSAGEVLSPMLYHRWKESIAVELLDGFGSTEVGHVFISNLPGRVVPGSAGRVVDGFEVKIVDDAGEPAPIGSVGHLWVRGPSLARGYWRDPERCEGVFSGGWVKTGDLFRSDSERNLYAVGRADDMIKVGCGQWVSPPEIESRLLEDHAVEECAVTGFSDDNGIIHTKAHIVLVLGQRANVELEQRLKRRVAENWPELPHKHVSQVEWVSELPRTATGKIQRYKLGPRSLTEFSYDC